MQPKVFGINRYGVSASIRLQIVPRRT